MQCLQKILVKYSIKINFVFPTPLRQLIDQFDMSVTYFDFVGECTFLSDHT